jgi:hypothetical protein
MELQEQPNDEPIGGPRLTDIIWLYGDDSRAAMRPLWASKSSRLDRGNVDLLHAHHYGEHALARRRIRSAQRVGQRDGCDLPQ